MNQHNLKHPYKELRALLGTRFSTDSAVRDAHARDASYHQGALPDAVAFPETNVEVADIVKICAKHKIPIIPYGTGTGVEGAVVATEGALCIALNEMNRILRVNPDDRDATVQAGVTRLQLNTHLENIGTQLHFPVDPGADASLGGMVATRASGTSAVRYGTMLDNVLGLDRRHCRRHYYPHRRQSPKIRRRLRSHPSFHRFGRHTRHYHRNHAQANTPTGSSRRRCLRFSERRRSRGHRYQNDGDTSISIARIELLDELQMDAVNKYAGLDYQVTPTLFLEFHGSEHTVAASSEIAGKIAALGTVVAISDGQQMKPNANASGRHDTIATTPHSTVVPGAVGYVTDVCVPISRLAECIAKTKALLATSYLAPINPWARR